MNKVFRNYSDSFDRYSNDYISWNANKKENSLILFNIFDIENETNNMEGFFSDFIDVNLFFPELDVHECTGILLDKTLFSFYADNFGGLYYSHFNVLKSDDYTRGKTVQQDNVGRGSFAKDSKILECYETFFLNSFYKENKTNPKLSYQNLTVTQEDEDEDDKLCKLSSDSEIDEDEYIEQKTDTDINFGTVRLNGISKKMYTIESGRKTVKALIDIIETESTKDDVKMRDEKEEEDPKDPLDPLDPKDPNVVKEEQENVELEWLFEALEDNLQYYK
jgi:hypothetical protein